jgi:excisionase family DNA binding protein
VIPNLRDVAQTLEVSETTVRKLVHSGSLPGNTVGKRGQLRIREEDIETFLLKQRVSFETGIDSGAFR